MKLLLTSGGLTNLSIARALFELVEKPASETKVAYIPTAMNVVCENKDWFIDDLVNIKKQGVQSIDIVDISALPKEMWEPRLEDADVLFFSGGNTAHLMRWIVESGLKELLPEWMKSKVWAGTSAGSMVTNPRWVLGEKDWEIYYEETFGYTDKEALGFVDFYIRPHFNSPDFPKANKNFMEEVAKETDATLYALDDMSAVKVDNGKVEVVSEGEYLILK